MRSNVTTLICLLGLGLAACHKPAPAPVKPEGPAYAPHGIEMEIKATGDLNQFDGLPHSLVVIVYQLRSTNAFNTLSCVKDLL
jgi:predicted component of type VI protein secretion system